MKFLCYPQLLKHRTFKTSSGNRPGEWLLLLQGAQHKRDWKINILHPTYQIYRGHLYSIIKQKRDTNTKEYLHGTEQQLHYLWDRGHFDKKKGKHHISTEEAARSTGKVFALIAHGECTALKQRQPQNIHQHVHLRHFCRSCSVSQNDAVRITLVMDMVQNTQLPLRLVQGVQHMLGHFPLTGVEAKQTLLCCFSAYECTK